LAEGSGRISKKYQAHFFSVSYSSLLELLNQFVIAHRIGYISDTDFQSVRDLVEGLPKKIAALRNATLQLSPKTSR
jgi:four helix bundle protein